MRLTLEDALGAPEGRGLDAIVAYLLGLPVRLRVSWHFQRALFESSLGLVAVPCFSTDLASAFRAAEALGVFDRFLLERRRLDDWRLVEENGEDYVDPIVFAPTVPLLLCRGILVCAAVHPPGSLWPPGTPPPGPLEEMVRQLRDHPEDRVKFTWFDRPIVKP